MNFHYFGIVSIPSEYASYLSDAVSRHIKDEYFHLSDGDCNSRTAAADNLEFAGGKDEAPELASICFTKWLLLELCEDNTFLHCSAVRIVFVLIKKI